MAMAPGWYPDPFSGMYQRYWDGTTWTSQTKAAEDRRTEAEVAAPTPPGPSSTQSPPPPYGVA